MNINTLIKKPIVLAVALLGILIILYFSLQTKTPSQPSLTPTQETSPSQTKTGTPQTPSPSPTPTTQKPAPTVTASKNIPPLPAFAPQTYQVSYFNNNFKPAVLTIKPGDTIEFYNNSPSPMWVASDNHPTHRLYPKAHGCIGSVFDSCRSLGQYSSWFFKFDIEGTWGYHNHVAPALAGVIKVTSPKPLLHLIRQGGLCPLNQICINELVVYKDKAYRYLINKKDEGGGSITEDKINSLTSAMAQTDFAKIRANKFTGECPIVSGGKENIYVFYASGGAQKISSCESVIDETLSIFETVKKITDSVYNWR